MPVSSHSIHSRNDLARRGKKKKNKVRVPRKYTQTKNSFGSQHAVQKGEKVALSDPANLRSRLLLREEASTPVFLAASIIRKHERLTRKPHQLCHVQKYNQSLAGVSCDSHARGRVLASFCLHACPHYLAQQTCLWGSNSLRKGGKFSPCGNPLWYKNKHWVGYFPISSFFFF